MKKILVVEDELSLAHILNAKLTKEDFTVLNAMNGEEALQLAFKEHPDLILLDILMPRMDGLVTMDKLREDVWGKTVPIIVLTNLGPDDKITEKILQHKPAYYLIKSDTKLEELVEKINTVINDAL
jgi:CheY-like chemotaxis protein